jgi:small-conductance mechanosensitive channel/CRP-like cAMP-binding protein
VLERLRHIQPSYAGLVLLVASLLVVLFLRRLLPASQRHRGKAPLLFLILSLILRLAATVAAVSDATSLWTVCHLLDMLFLAFGITGVCGMLVFDIALGHTRLRVPPILRDLIQAAVFAVIVMSVLRKSGVNLLSLVTTSAVLTAVVGLALQSTLSNVFAGLSLQLDQTLRIGDWIQMAAHVGQIATIKWRSTSIVTRDGDTVIVPNGELLREAVVNLCRPRGAHRRWVRVGLAYRHPPNEVKAILLAALGNVPGVLSDPAPDCVPGDFGDHAVIYALGYWVEDIARDFAIDGEVRTRVWYAAQRAGLEIPFPVRTVHMTEMSHDHGALVEERDFAECVLALASIDLFAPLTASDRELLAKGMKKVRFAAAEEIIRQGDPGDSLYLILQGLVAVQLSVDGAVREVATLGPGDFFGEMSLMTGEPRKATCAARSDVSCYLVDHASFQALLDEKPSVAEEICALLGTRQLALEGQREGLTVEAAARRAAEAKARLLSRIRDFFHLG